MSKNKGFTLIELLVVIAIIGILAAAALASLGTARTKGQVAAVKSQLSNMRAQAELYYTSNTGTGVNSGYAPAATACGTPASNTLFTNAATAPIPGLAGLLNGVVSSAGGDIGLPANNIYCFSTASAWAIAVKLPGNNGYYCVDSAGRSTDKTTGNVAYNGLIGAAPAAIVSGTAVCN